MKIVSCLPLLLENNTYIFANKSWIGISTRGGITQRSGRPLSVVIWNFLTREKQEVCKGGSWYLWLWHSSWREEENWHPACGSEAAVSKEPTGKSSKTDTSEMGLFLCLFPSSLHLGGRERCGIFNGSQPESNLSHQSWATEGCGSC